jgi:hypothetical protein
MARPGDCTHALAGKTVDMIDLDEELKPQRLAKAAPDPSP